MRLAKAHGVALRQSYVRVGKIALIQHQTIIECSQNSFFIDALTRVDRLRRLIDYRQMLDRPTAIMRCREHLELLDLLLADRRVEASEFMKRHLSELSDLKTIVREKSAGGETKRADAAE